MNKQNNTTNKPQRWFNNLPLDSKLTATVFTTTIAILAIISFALIAMTWISGTNSIKDNLSIHAKIIKNSATTALLYKDTEAALKSLDFLKEYHSIIDAHIIDSNNISLAEYGSEEHSTLHQKLPKKEGFHFIDDHITLTEFIYHENKKIGSMHIASDYSNLYNAIAWQAGFTLLVLVISFMIAVLIAKVLHNSISKPIKDLFYIVDKVSTNNDYSLRAKKTSNDEIGTLVDKFNEMLTVIEQSNKTIEKQNRNLLTAQSLSKVGNWEWNPTTNTVHLSPQALQLLDLPSNIVDPPLDFLISRLEDKYASSFKEAVGILLSREQSYTTVEYKIRLINGSSRSLVDELNVEYDSDGGIANIIGVTQDITNRKKTSDDLQMMERLDSISLFAGGIAHDFNNLLTIIMGYLDLAKTHAEEVNDPKIYQIIDQTEKATYRGKDLTHQLITFSRGNSPSKVPLSLKAVLPEIVNSVFRGSNITHTLNYKNNTLNINADHGQLRQAINNIYLNAKESMTAGGLVTTSSDLIILEQSNKQGLPPGYYVTIQIRDEGSGINKLDIQKIFDPYFTTKKDKQGLGISTAYSIIKNHGGILEVESQLNKGTEITIYLPAIEEEVTIDEIRSNLKEKGEGRILLLEDEEPIGRYISTLLTRCGYMVDHVLKGEDAIALYNKSIAENKLYKVVIIDLTIKGGMGGKEAIKELLQINPKIKAIVSSGYSKDPIMEDYKKFGFTASVSKPYRSIDLLTTISKTIKNEESEIN